MHKPLRVQIGPTVKQHNRFHFKRQDVYRGEQAIESTHYYVVLEHKDGSEESIGLIRIQESSLLDFLSYLYHWLRQQFVSIYQAKQQLGQIAEDDEMRATVQLHIEDLERRYNHVVQAVREIVPDYQLDESNPDPSVAALNEKLRQKLQSKPRTNIRMETGATVKQYGRFHLKENKLYRDEREIPTNRYEVMLDNGDGSYESLGLIESEKSSLLELLDHLHGWLHARYNVIYQIKQLQKRTKNDEMRAGYQQGMDAWELQYARVDHAIREIEPDYEPDESIYDGSQGL